MTPTRRDLMLGMSALLLPSPLMAAPARKRAAGELARKPKRLRPGDTVGLIEPASASDEAFDLVLVEEAIVALGLKPKRAAHLLQRYGYLAGTDAMRAADVNAMFADKDVDAIFAVRGGWGCARLLPHLDYDLIRANPKLLLGYSDITALHMALAARCGFVTLHGPNGNSVWGKRSVESFKQVAFEGATPLYRNPLADEDRLVQKKWRTQLLHAGTARGRLLGGNLTVLTALVGSGYLPNFDGAILFIEDIDEAEYRIDRMLTQLKQAGILNALSGVIFGQCTNCRNTDNGAGAFMLTDVLQQHLATLGVPAFQGGFFGHISDQFTLPQGVMAEMDADAGTLRLLEAAVQ